MTGSMSIAIMRGWDKVKVLRLEPYQQGAQVVFEADHLEEVHDYIEQHDLTALVIPVEKMSAELWDRRNNRLYGDN